MDVTLESRHRAYRDLCLTEGVRGASLQSLRFPRQRGVQGCCVSHLAGSASTLKQAEQMTIADIKRANREDKAQGAQGAIEATQPAPAPSAPLHTTPLHALHLELGAKMAGFAGYDMPIHYPLGVLGEHNHTRKAAGLFDVSHMGQARLVANDKGASASALFERLTPAALTTLKPNHMRYGLLTNEQGGIIDDLMMSHIDDGLWLVINAADKQAKFAYLSEHLADKAVLEIAECALLALQGPQAADILAQIFPEVMDLRFMQTAYVVWQGAPVLLSRCGYTGEDGFEISLPAELGEEFARLLLAQQGVAPVGLGARDSLRLEAGLCLYGQDIDATTTPIEADLAWTVSKQRLQAGDFLGADIIKAQLATGAARKRVGIAPQTRAPARTGTQIQNMKDEPIGQVTSGGFAPSLNAPIAMGYVATDYAALDTELNLLVRGNAMPAKITTLPFVAHNYYRSRKT